MKVYDHKSIEAKWQKVWEESGAFHALEQTDKPKFYALIEFPYPSGAGLHVGHPRSNTAMDIIARKRRMEGYNVLFPIGWDAFGLPTENYAIKNHVHPAGVTQKNIDHFREQLKRIGFSFDWTREVNTTDPNYFRWTQWIFLQLYKHGLAYKSEMPVNWCPSCKCGLANEEVVSGKCERCGAEVIRRVKSQWMLKITAYAQKLLDGLDDLDFIEKVKVQQRNWIGRSEGAEVDFAIEDSDMKLRVYTTRPDTLFGATYMVVAPEHAAVDKLRDRIENWDEVVAYRDAAARKSDFERTELVKEKTGVELRGVKAIDPVNGHRIPVFIADYVLSTYGTGAIMAVPAHDTRDWEFAKKFGLPIVEVVAGGNVQEAAYTDVADGEEDDHRLAGGARRRRAQGELQAARLGVLAPALLGRADPAGVLREVRLGAGAGGSAAGAAAGGGQLRADGFRREPAVQDRQLGEHDLPVLRRPGAPGDGHHAPVGGIVLVLPALRGCALRQRAGPLRRAQVLDAGGLVQRRHGAHDAAPAVLAVLEPVPA